MSLDVRYGEGDRKRDVIADGDGDLYEILSHPRRSMVCSLLLERGGSLSMTELVSMILTFEDTDPTAMPSAEQRRDVHVDLYHRHLPMLVTHGLLAWDRRMETVTLADDPDVDVDRLEAFLEPLGIHRSGELFELLAHPRRRTVLVALDRGDTVAVDELATRIVAIEAGISTDAVSPSDATRAHIDLRHVHLPAMADLDVVDYDHSSDRVTYRGHPALLGR
ncbi:DUF7344 domain-containing protein [Natronobeatus ordinarius]|uniref:DUF7344 domain-containing protein n=1 Tax=Natronobeatus ordinarius TaxID=2963433 RepID=UPI0020CF822F|nr:hypothetical protein [Natronobeatus ordinarius]